MNEGVAIASAAVVILCVVAVASAAVAAALTFVRLRHFGRQTSRLRPPNSRTGISVAVCGSQSIDDIRRRLTESYTPYELIVVCDFDRTPESADILRHYSMVRMRLRDEDMRRCGAIEIYRSRQRRYRNFMLANRAESDADDCRDCAVAMASFENVVLLDGSTFLAADALARFGEAAERWPHSRIEGQITPPPATDAVEAIVWAIKVLFGAIGTDAAERVEMLAREDVIACGGYANVGRGARRRKIGAAAQIFETHTTASLRRRRAATSLTALWLIFVCLAAVEARGAETITLLLAALAVYAAATAVGAIALFAVGAAVTPDIAPESLKTSQRKLFSFPIEYLFRTITGTNWRCFRKKR